MRQTVGTDLTEREIHDAPEVDAGIRLAEQYQSLVASHHFSWFSNIQFLRQLGTGGQGAVFLAERIGSDGFQVPVAVKFYAPDRYGSLEEYDEDMKRVADVARCVSQIHHPNLLAVNHFLNRDRIRVMVMEWIQGFDLRRLLTAQCYGVVKERVSRKMWEVYNEKLVTSGPVQPRFRPQVVLSIVKWILKSLVALHDEGIVHSDIKPSNMMLTRAGSAKLIDIGSAIRTGERSWRNGCTPTYAAMEVLMGDSPSVESDLVSLGYVAMELLTGKPLFPGSADLDLLLEAKRDLELSFLDYLPEEVVGDKSVTDLLACLLRAQRFVAPAGFSTTDLIGEMLEDVSELTASDLIKVWIDELWELDPVDGHDSPTS